MANLLLLQLSSSSASPSHLVVNPNHGYCIGNYEKLLWRSIVSRSSYECRAAGGPGWDGGGSFRFDSEEKLRRGDGGFDRFEFGNREKKRTWWSDYHDDDYDYDDWDDDEGGKFWVSEVFRAFSWMLAPIGISLLLGTDSNAVLMALAVPFAQSILSLVIDKTWDRPRNSSGFRPVRRTRRRPFARSATVSNTRTGSRRQEDYVAGTARGGYKSWVVGDADSNETGSGYGGWDDLDRPKETGNVPKNPSGENGRPKQQYKRKVSRTGRVREKPLFLRMLIAVFPFLGSWTKLLF